MKHCKICGVILAVVFALSGLASCNLNVPVSKKEKDILIENGACPSGYRIIYPDGAEQAVADLAFELRDKIETATGVKPETATDFEREGTKFQRTDYEILIGQTNREESLALDKILYRDFAVTYQTTRIAIYGKSVEALEKAVGWFADNCLDGNAKTLSVLPKLNHREAFDYSLKTLTIGGNPIAEYEILTEPSEKEKAYPLQEAVANLCGFVLPIVTAPTDGKRSICLGNATSASRKQMDSLTFDQYCIATDADGTLYLGSNGKRYGSEYAVTALIDEYLQYDTNAKSRKAGTETVCTLLNLSVKGKIEDMNCKLIEATPEYLAGIDAKADTLKSGILGTKNTIDPSTYKKGTVYYVSSSMGSDNNSGKSPAAAWKTLDKVNAAGLKEGDAVLFKRGDLWRGGLKTQSGVTYSSYGSGEKPRIYGSPENAADASKWSLMPGTNNIWVYYRDMNDVGELVFNGGDSYARRIYFSFNWETKEYYRYNSTTVKFDILTELNADLTFFSAANSKYETKTVDRGDGLMYNLAGMPMINDAECVGKLYLRCDAGNPGEVFDEIEFCTMAKNQYGHIVTGDLNRVTIDNLCLRYGGVHGIGGGDNDGLTVTNCEIGWIGGNVHSWVPFGDQDKIYKTVALGNAVEVARSCTNFTVANNWIYQCYDTAITNQSSFDSSNYRQRTVENLQYRDNLIEYNSNAFEIWLSGNLPENQTPIMKNILVEGNICRFTGYGFGFESRPNKDVGGFLSGGFSGKGAKCNRAENFVIRNNIFDRSGEAIPMFCQWAGKVEWLPKMEGNTYINNYGHRFGQLGIKSDAELNLAYIDFKNMSRHLWDFTIDDFIINQIGDKTATVAIITK